jgi:hypothetical protein
VIAMKGTGYVLLVSLRIFSEMCRSFHFELLVAEGETDCPFNRNSFDSSGCCWAFELAGTVEWVCSAGTSCWMLGERV